ncbi:MAG: alpha/beta hydrolase [Lysobacteraceae bacterium]|nr:MAG: alpha/beta hydrolase [Xanthomonadaceae bacterium]
MHEASAGGEAGVVVQPRAGGFDYGRLHFTACELPQPQGSATTAAWCAPFEVPEDPDAATTGRRIGLRLALVASDAAAPEPDPVVLLAGGPGQSAVESWPQVAAAFAPLLRHRHVLLLDQRGTGGSNALACPRAADEFDRAFDAARVRAQARECLASVSTHADPRQYTTAAALRDLEAVREALGAPRLNLIGVSYGTRVAQQYMKRHPAAVRSVVLDSAVPNDLVLGSEFASNLDDSLRAQLGACSATPACAQAFGGPWANLRALQASLRQSPMDVAYRDPVSHAPRQARLDAFTLAMLARLYAYAPETAALLPLTVARARDGDAAPMLGQLGMLERDLESLGENVMQYSVACAEDAPWLEPRAADADTLLGSTLSDVFRETCTVWPRGERAADFAEPARGETPVLLLAGEFDPITPPRYAERIAAALPNSRVLVAKGQGHSVMGRGCLPRLVGEFVADLDPAHLDAGCVADFGPLPAFLDFNGAAP